MQQIREKMSLRYRSGDAVVWVLVILCIITALMVVDNVRFYGYDKPIHHNSVSLTVVPSQDQPSLKKKEDGVTGDPAEIKPLILEKKDSDNKNQKV